MITKVMYWLCGDSIPVEDAWRLILQGPKEVK